MIIVIKEQNNIHIFRTTSRKTSLERDPREMYHPDNQSIQVIDQHAVLVMNLNKLYIDLIKPHIKTSMALSFDMFIELDLKALKKALKEDGLMRPDHMKSKVYEDEVMVYAKHGEYIVVEGFEHVIPSKDVYVSSSSIKFLPLLLHAKEMPPKARVIKTLIHDMDHSIYNYFPLEYVNTLDQTVEIITLKEAICPSGSL